MGHKKRNSGNRTRAGLPSAVLDAGVKELPEQPAPASPVPSSASPDGSAEGTEMVAGDSNGVEANGVADTGCILDTHEMELGSGVQSTPMAIIAKSNNGVRNGVTAGSAKSGNSIYENGGEELEGDGEGPHGDVSSVKADYEKALLAFRRGNHNKALRLMKECCAQHENFPLSHRLQGNICMKIASLIEDPGLKQRHMKTAIESARKAVLLSPQSIEFAHYYAQLLYEASNDSKDYEEVVRECERALSIENPVDPVKDSFQDDSQLKHLTPHARITHVQQELRTLVQKSNIASISSWMKNLGTGTGEEKFRLIPMRRLSEDPLEVRMLQSRRPHEIKKNIKTPEERRKEIEVRVAAARLLQQRNDAPLTSSDQRSNQLTTGNHRGERRKGTSARKLLNGVSIEDKMEQVKPFWHSVDMQKRQAMFEISVEDLKSHWISSKDNTILDILSEALSFAHAKKPWRFWVCCKCNDKFADNEAFMQHVLPQHVERLLPKLQSVIPQEVDKNWADQLLNGDCRPIDAHSAVKILLRSKCDIKTNISITEQLPSVSNGPDSTGSSCLHNCSENFIDCADKSSDQIAAVGEDGSTLLEESQSHTFNNIEFVREAGHSYPATDKECNNQKLVVGDNLVEQWPLVDDTERAKLLESIYRLFRSLIKHKCLAASHLCKVVQYAVDELQIFVPELSMQCEIRQSPVYIRFLQVHQLQNVFKYLGELAHACGLDRYSDKISTSNGTEDHQEDEVQESLILTDDFTSIVLDERLLKNIDNRSNFGESIDVAVSHLTRFSLKEWQDRIPLIDLQLLWVFGTSSHDLQPPAWTQLREEKSQQGIEVLRTLEKEFYHLQALCQRKCEHVSYEEALNAAERLCLEELKKREQSGKVASQSYEALLKKRQEELVEGHNNSLLSHCKFELDAITNILKEAQNLPRLGYEDSLSTASACLTELDYAEDDEWRMQEYLHQTDSCIEVAIQRQKDQLSTEVSKLDAKIMRNVFGMQQLEVKLGHLASFDYRVVILPLIKSYLKSRFEDAAEKDATEKSDAAREAFLAELALDAKSNDEKGSDQPKHPHEKSKDKKKNKDQRKAKDLKGSSNGGQQSILKGNIGGCIIDDDNQDKTGIKKWTAVEELKKKEEDELKLQVELEAEERKLEETLEYQRRIEEEAKQKHLAELSKKQGEESKLSMPKESKSIIVGNETHLDLLETTSLINGFSNGSPLQDTNYLLSENKMFSNWTYAEEVATCTEKRDLRVEDYKSYSRHQDKRAHAAKDRSYPGSSGSQNHNSARNVGRVDKGSLVDEKKRLPRTEMGQKYSGETVFPGSMANIVNNQERQRFQDSELHSYSRSAADSSLQVTERDSSSSVGQRARGQRTRQNVSLQIAERGTCAYIPKTPPKHDISQGPDSSFENSVVEDVDAHMPLSLSVINKHGTSNNEMQMRTITGSKQGATFTEKPGSVPGENSSKTLRQLHAEEDDEERFQADLEQAVRQSLDTYNAKHSSLLFCDVTKNEGGFSITDGTILPASGLPVKTVTEVDNFGRGLQNEVGEYNCFLNVIIQSLWQLRRFREEFLALSSSQHVHLGEPCVVCALYNIFVALSTVATEATAEAVAPTSLRNALSMLYPESNFFQQAQMNDASEVLAVIFDCLHQAFTSNGSTSDTESDGSAYKVSWDCQGQTCIAHKLFGLNISEQMNCKTCGVESRHLKYTSFFHNINASALRTMKIMYMESSLDELLKLVEMNDQLVCDTEVGGCGQSNYIHHLLAAAPYVFTTVLGWQNNCENVEDITATLDAITTVIDVGVIYRGLDEGCMHRLVSVVCYYGQHYHCFAYSSEHERWVMYDDTTVKVVGGWDDVTDTCRRGHLQPQVLFYEAVE